MNYDSAQIRKLARGVQSTANGIRDQTSGSLRAARVSVTENLCGKTADALTAALEELGGDVSKMVMALDGIASELYAYAKRLDEADRQAQQLIDKQ